MKRLLIILALLCSASWGQISVSLDTSANQAILNYTSPISGACSLQVADMNRGITIASGSQTGGTVTITTRAPHGLLSGAVVYLENTGITGWNGWQTLTGASTTTFTFTGSAGTAATGNVGVLVDDLNPALFSGADQDSRAGNANTGTYGRVFVVGQRTAALAVDGSRYTRALQTASRHHYTLTCGASVQDGDFTTQTLVLGDTHNDGLPVDLSHPGQYAYPTVQWSNRAQALIDPITGVRSARSASPLGTPSAVQSFQTAIDHAAAWTTPSGPLGVGGTATFTGPCSSGTCALFLRADSLSLPGGATYTGYYGVGSSLDWATVTISNASISNGSCAGDDCKLAACLTVNGVTCTSAERDVPLTKTPTSYTLGSTSPIDLWQGSGSPGIASPDVSRATGAVNYTSSTRQLTWVSGSQFSVKWAPGSRIIVAGSEYQIESIQSELSLTLTAPGPVGDLYQGPYSANNFGVLVWKKTSAADTVTIGYTTFLYGSTTMDTWISSSDQLCSALTVTSGGASGYNCFIGYEMYWIAVDGSDVRDMGAVGLPDTFGVLWSTGYPCGDSGTGAFFDPSVDADTWYCLVPFHPFGGAPWPSQAIIKAHYNGSHAAGVPGALIPGCNQNGNVQPCITFTPMQPLLADGVDHAGPAFATNYDSSYVATNWAINGISSDGEVLISTRELGSSDTRSWFYVFALGDRTPAGTDAGSIHVIAAASSYRYKAPCTFCGVHSGVPPSGGWAWLPFQDLSWRGAAYSYGMTLTSSLLTTSLSTCPSNPLGVTGVNCTSITTSGEPSSAHYGAGTTQVGDVILIDGEYMRIVVKTDATDLVVQRGYLSTVASHGGTALSMFCSAVSRFGVSFAIWDYRDDAYGQNTGWTTILPDVNNFDGHQGNGPGVIADIGTWGTIGTAACPPEILTTYGTCYAVRRGATPPALITAPYTGTAIDPPFSGVMGLGNPNAVDSHPGPCTSQWCTDGRPYDGGTDDVGVPLGTAGTPFTNVTGQLWKLAGGATNLLPKFLATFAYVGRSALVDVSGPSSNIPTDSTGSYTYCVTLVAGECRARSSVNDVFVNAPYVSYGYCPYPGIAQQGDDTNAICIGPLGVGTGNLVQFGLTQDSTGATQRRLGPAFSRWKQQSVFWNMSITPTGQIGFSQVRWLDGVRSENIITAIPQYRTGDTVDRSTFIPISVTIPAPGDSGVNAEVEFWYTEDGGFCTSRQEACVVAGSTIQAVPWYWESETFSRASCASGCTITIPALSQRVLYYRVKRYSTGGALIATGDTMATIVGDPVWAISQKGVLGRGVVSGAGVVR